MTVGKVDKKNDIGGKGNSRDTADCAKRYLSEGNRAARKAS
jgi:hypothetical protein